MPSPPRQPVEPPQHEPPQLEPPENPWVVRLDASLRELEVMAEVAAKLQQQQGELRESLADMGTVAGQLHQRQDALCTSVNSFSQRFNAVQEEFRLLKESSNHLNQENAQLQAAMAALQLRYDDQTELIVRLNTDLVESNAARQQSDATVSELTIKLNDCTANQGVNRETIDALEKSIEKLQQELADCKTNKSEMEQKLTELQSQRENEGNQHEAQMNVLQNRIAELEQQNQNLTAAITTTTEERDRLLTQQATLDAQIKTLLDEKAAQLARFNQV